MGTERITMSPTQEAFIRVAKIVIRDLRENGMTLREIAEEYGITPEQVRMALEA